MMRNISVVFLLIMQLAFLQAQNIELHIFLLDDCVISRAKMSQINDLHNQFGNEIDFIGYFPNAMSSKKDINLFREELKVSFPLKTDHFKKMVDSFNVTITPEVILYDSQLKEVLYRGAVDNEFLSIGKRRRVITKYYLRDALEANSLGKTIKVPISQAVGCFIYNN